MKKVAPLPPTHHAETRRRCWKEGELQTESIFLVTESDAASEANISSAAGFFSPPSLVSDGATGTTLSSFSRVPAVEAATAAAAASLEPPPSWRMV